MKVILDLFSAGFCTNIERMVNRKGKLASMRFPAICALIKHPVEGYILFDTGYSERVLKETSTFPMNLYRLTTPIYFTEDQSAVNQLRKRGISPDDVKHVILSHFHIDHMGGLKDFPKANYIYSFKAYQSSRRLTGFKALLSAYTKNLEPLDMEKRSTPIKDFKSSLPYPEFNLGHDLFGDGSINVVELPGHAAGQIGLFLQTEEGPSLLAADASWTMAAIRELQLPHPLARLIIHDYTAFLTTLNKLHQLHLKRPDIRIIPSHCQEVLSCTNY